MISHSPVGGGGSWRSLIKEYILELVLFEQNTFIKCLLIENWDSSWSIKIEAPRALFPRKIGIPLGDQRRLEWDMEFYC